MNVGVSEKNVEEEEYEGSISHARYRIVTVDVLTNRIESNSK